MKLGSRSNYSGCFRSTQCAVASGLIYGQSDDIKLDALQIKSAVHVEAKNIATLIVTGAMAALHDFH
jgi:hypothetical protein